ncbi:MAG: transglycosylase domain-containing protein, partial [Acutalibacteraceae bacterium]
LSYFLCFTVVLTIFCLPSYKKINPKIDILSTSTIVNNIKNMELNMTSVIYVKNKKSEWEEYYRIHGSENRLWISIDKMPKNLLNAFIAIEDETFYKHSGINWKRTFGAIGNYFLKFDETEFGGSTITQQLIKNITSDNDKSIFRKVREIIRALIIEKKLSKKEILEAYLNTIALGNGICGVQVAANYYFNKDVSELDLSECVTLAAITKNPSRYNPVTGLDANRQRRNIILKKMIQLKMISAKDLLDTYDVQINIDDSQKEELEPEINSYFVDTLIQQVIEDLMEKYNCTEQIASTMLYNGGFKIYSTEVPEIQQAMEAVYLNINKYFPYKGKNLQGETVHAQSAMTIMDYNGHIVGIVGGAGPKTVNRGLNRAYNSPRQPGSTMKPIGVYALAIDTDLIHYSSKVVDKPIDNYYPDGKKGPAEWYGYYKGTITVDYAIRKSANTIPVILLQKLGIETSYNFLTKKLNLKHLTPEDKNLASLALGGCVYGLTTTESAAAYAIFGNQGVYHKPTTYTKIERINGEVVLEYDEKGTQVISPATATIMNHLLQGVVYGREGTGSGIRSFSSMKAFAKTGTSSESKDLWMVAGSPYYVGAVWYGFDKQQVIKSTSAAATIWRDVMAKVHKGLPHKTFEDSKDVYKKGSGYYKVGTTPDNLIISTGESSSSSTSSVSSQPSSSQTTSSGNTSSATSDITSSDTSTDTSSNSSGGDSSDTSSVSSGGSEPSTSSSTSGSSSNTSSGSTSSRPSGDGPLGNP